MKAEVGAAARRPRVRLDHVLVAVPDLDEAARDFETRYGLLSVPGGRHPGAGTANRIIPLGREYLELIAVVDGEEALASPRSMRVRRAVERGRRFAGWAARTNQLDALRSRLLAAEFSLPDSLAGARAKPDGTTLRWRSQDVSTDPEELLPFVIEWQVPAGMHPGRTPIDHRAGATGIRGVVLGHPEPQAAKQRLEQALGRGLRTEIRDNQWPGVLEVRLSTPGGELVIS